MEDNTPPEQGLHFDPNWLINHDESNNLPLEQIGFTNSQTQILDSIIGVQGLLPSDPNPHNNLYLDSSAPFINYHGSGLNVYPTLNSCPVPLLQENVLTPALPSLQLNMNGIPSMENWAGEFNFQVEFNRAQDQTKATPWIFSKTLGKLYVQKDKACPINFKLAVEPHVFKNYQVRSKLVYSQAEHFHEAVECCGNHSNRDLLKSHNSDVLICDDINAEYVSHGDNKPSVVVKLQQPAPGTQSETFYYRFKCLSSCIGSINRRPTKVIFTLETLSGVEVGRYVVDARICSCPGRDIRSDEEKFVTGSQGIGQEQLNRGDLIPIQLPQFKPKIKKRKQPNPQIPNNSDDDIYTITVRGKKNYEVIKYIAQKMNVLIPEVPEERTNTDWTNLNKRFKEEHD